MTGHDGPDCMRATKSPGGRAVLTVKQVAGRVGVGVNLVYAWCQAGELGHYRFGAPGSRGKILIGENDLAKFLAARWVGGTDTPPVRDGNPPGVARARAPAGPLRHVKVRHRRQG